MKSVGIIAEYNPFHNGHLYQIQKVKEKTEADVVVIVMSGNFLQRGEPAILDKWTRTEMALRNGADLVVELPVVFSTQAADFFARGSIQILNHLGVDEICFGVESGTSKEYSEAGKWFVDNEEKINEGFSTYENLTYAERMTKVLHSLNSSFPIDLTSPNNQLGFAYAREIYKYKFPLKINVLKRKDSNYHDTALSTDKKISSATSIRKALHNNENISKTIPENIGRLVNEKPYVRSEDFWSLIQYRFVSSSTSELQKIYQMEDGIEHRLKEKALSADSLEEFIEVVKPKHLTYNRIQRICLYTLLNMTKDEVYNSMHSIQAIHLLGFSTKGQKFLSDVKSQLKIPLLSNINQKNDYLWEMDIRAGNLYRLADLKEIPIQDYKRNPIKILT